MSNQNNELIMEYIGEEVAELWQLPTRPDLEADCCDYVWEHYDENTISNLIIAFLSTHCDTAVSSKDIEAMSLQHKCMTEADSV